MGFKRKYFDLQYNISQFTQGYSVTQTATSTYDSANKKLTSGIWVNLGPPGGTGKFTMQEVN